MTDTDLIRLVERYFGALDARDPEALSRTLDPACVLAIVTHGIRHEGRDAIVALFSNRWRGDTLVRHHDFRHVPNAAGDRIASQFLVTYTRPGEPHEVKSNANVFTAKDGRLTHIEVYMSGENTIRPGS